MIEIYCLFVSRTILFVLPLLSYFVQFSRSPRYNSVFVFPCMYHQLEYLEHQNPLALAATEPTAKQLPAIAPFPSVLFRCLSLQGPLAMALTEQTAKRMFSVSQFPTHPQQTGRLVDLSILHIIPGSGVRLLSHRQTPYIHTSSLYNAHCYDLHHHCYLIFNLRAIPCVAACSASL